MKNLNEIIEEVKSHNFDNGNFVITEGVEISCKDYEFKVQLTNEVITLKDLDELKEYGFLF